MQAVVYILRYMVRITKVHQSFNLKLYFDISFFPMISLCVEYERTVNLMDKVQDLDWNFFSLWMVIFCYKCTLCENSVCLRIIIMRDKKGTSEQIFFEYLYRVEKQVTTQTQCQDCCQCHSINHHNWLTFSLSSKDIIINFHVPKIDEKSSFASTATSA
jgi:hypothetical protein